MGTVFVTVLIVVAGVCAGRIGSTLALFVDVQSVGANAFSTATLSAPANPSATASCDATGTLKGKIAVSWSAATNATSYDVFRGNAHNGPYSLLANRATTSYTDTGLATNTAFYYVIQTKKNNWASGNSAEVTATTPIICT